MSVQTASPTQSTSSAVPLHIYLGRLIDERDDLTNVEIARRLGYPRPNVIAMMRTGTMKVPLNKVPRLAEILNIEPISLLQRVLSEYEPELWATLTSVLGHELVSRNELALIRLLREQTGGADPDLASNELFVEGFKALVGEAIDIDVAKQLAARPTETARRVGEAAKVNEQLEELCRRQARERQVLRKRLIEGTGL